MTKEQEKIKETLKMLESKASELQKKMSVKADGGEMGQEYKDLCCYCDNLCNMIFGLRDYVYQSDARLWDAIYEHKKNHIPALDAGAMEKFLKAVGISDSYRVEKPTIYIQASKNGNKTYNIDLSNIKKS